MAVTFDNSALSAYKSGVASGTAITLTETAAAGAYAIVTVSNTGGGLTSAAVAAATFGGTSMTLLGHIAVNNVDSNGLMWVFGLANVTGGANQTASVTLTQATTSFTGWAAAYTYLGVASAGSLVTNFGSSTASLVVVPSAAGNMVWGALFDNAGNTFSSPTFTQRQANNVNTNQPAFVAGDMAGVASTTFGATMSSAFTWGAAGLNLIAAAPAGGGATSVIIPTPFVGPMAMRHNKRMPYYGYRSASFADGANQTVTFTTSDDGFVDHPGAKTSVIIPNPFVGPTALRQRKRLPYVATQRQGYTDGANSGWVFSTSDDGFIDHPGAQTSVLIPNPFVGPQALRNRKHMPYVASQKQGYTDGANTTWTFTTSDDGHRGITDAANSTWTFATSDDGFVDHPGAKTSVIIPNPNVGPMALRHVKHTPYYTYVHGSGVQALSDGANSTWVFTTSTDGHRGITDGANTTIVWVTSDDGFVDHPGARTSVIIPNRFVGPQALRNSKHPPYVASQRQGYTDAANSAWVFTTSDNGRRGITDSANSTWVFTTSDNGFRGIKDGANTTIIWVTSDDGTSSGATVLGAKTGVLIPNPYVGPMGLRHLKRMPYQTYRSASFADTANSGWVFHTSDDGHRGISDGASSVWAFGHSVNGIRGVRDGANLLITFSESDQGHVGRRDGANISIVVGHSNDGHVGRRDGAPLTISFATSDDGNLSRFLIDVLPGNIVIVGPNETRSVTITPEALTQIIRAAGYIVTVTDEQRTFTIPAGGAIQIV